ncbi:MAG: hypothetical protein H6Q66_1412 [Firmicutes bacterium]|nr:hypothetical protein [Bacillota bacterium]
MNRQLSAHNINNVKNYIYEIGQNNKRVDNLFHQLNRLGDVILIGGAIRDIALKNKYPRDIDLIINTKERLDEYLGEFNFEKNSLEGYKISIEKFTFDIWTTESNWAYKERIINCSVEEIPKGAFYDFDSVTINLSDGKFYVDYFNKAIASNLLDIMLEDHVVYRNPSPAINIIRAIKIRENWGLDFSKRLMSYMQNWLANSSNPADELRYAEKKHYKMESFNVDNDRIEKFLFFN